MNYWRGLLTKLGLTPVEGVGPEANEPGQPEAVEPPEVALLLLKGASHLVNRAMAPPEVSASLAMAIRELEKHIAARSG